MIASWSNRTKCRKKIEFFCLFRSFGPLTRKRLKFGFPSYYQNKKIIKIGLVVMVIQKCRIFPKMSDWTRSFGFMTSYRSEKCRIFPNFKFLAKATLILENLDVGWRHLVKIFQSYGQKRFRSCCRLEELIPKN